MEKFPMGMPNPNLMPMPNVPNPYVAPEAVNPALVGPPPMYPVNVHAAYEEINIYPPKKHYFPVYGAWTTTGAILVLFILLVIILRSGRHC